MTPPRLTTTALGDDAEPTPTPTPTVPTPATPPTKPGGGQLPATGAPVALVLLGVAALVGTGASLRARVPRAPHRLGPVRETR